MRESLDAVEEISIGGKPATVGLLEGRSVVLLVAGMGKTNAAQALTALLETRRVAGVIGFGVAGAYSGSGLGVGGVALATREIYGDEGVLVPEGWLSTREIGIPLIGAGPTAVYNEIELDGARVDRACEALTRAGLNPVPAVFVTVSSCSGTEARGLELARRFEAGCETMEGAAYAHVSALYGVPFLEVRGISNLVEDRDLNRWRLQDAAVAAAAAVRTLTRDWD